MKRVFLKANACLLLFIYLFSFAASGAPIGKSDDFTAINCYTGVDIPVFCKNDGYEEAVSSDVRVSSRLFELLFGKKEEKKSDDELLLYPGGSVFGLLINEDGVTVTHGSESKVLHAGDRILTVDGKAVSAPSDVEDAIKNSGGRKLTLGIVRGGESITLTVTPKLDGGEYKLGVKLRSQTAGIGTVTYVNPETLSFGGLGHGVSDADSGEFVSIKSASVNKVALGGCKRGDVGHAGELTGILKQDSFGRIFKNCECGVFGSLTELPAYCTEPMPAGTRAELCEGAAQIISTVKNGHRDTYSIEIYDIDRDSTGSKSFKIRVTDPTLITLTGGIVRGMSGSPIIQNGKLVGAVTHVMLANPTEGYGIFIENMLNSAQAEATPSAA